jgi:hypothetical protein
MFSHMSRLDLKMLGMKYTHVAHLIDIFRIPCGGCWMALGLGQTNKGLSPNLPPDFVSTGPITFN